MFLFLRVWVGISSWHRWSNFISMVVTVFNSQVLEFLLQRMKHFRLLRIAAQIPTPDSIRAEFQRSSLSSGRKRAGASGSSAQASDLSHHPFPDKWFKASTSCSPTPESCLPRLWCNVVYFYEKKNWWVCCWMISNLGDWGVYWSFFIRLSPLFRLRKEQKGIGIFVLPSIVDPQYLFLVRGWTFLFLLYAVFPYSFSSPIFLVWIISHHHHFHFDISYRIHPNSSETIISIVWIGYVLSSVVLYCPRSTTNYR